MPAEIDVTALLAVSSASQPNLIDNLVDAIDAASDQDHKTYLTVDGKRIAAIVPVDVAEEDELTTDAVVRAVSGVQIFNVTQRPGGRPWPVPRRSHPADPPLT
jgi:hypothetical protein